MYLQRLLGKQEKLCCRECHKVCHQVSLSLHFDSRQLLEFHNGISKDLLKLALVPPQQHKEPLQACPVSTKSYSKK